MFQLEMLVFADRTTLKVVDTANVYRMLSLTVDMADTYLKFLNNLKLKITFKRFCGMVDRFPWFLGLGSE